MGSEMVILVDERDNEIGTEEKLRAHQSGFLHRAFSIFVFNGNWEKLLLQQRALSKYHGGGLWTNTCCSHPRPGETTIDAAHRRLQEEMRFDCELEESFSFKYRAQVENGLLEHEWDHVFVGRYDGAIVINRTEVEACKWVKVSELMSDVRQCPEIYTTWFKMCVGRVLNSVQP